MRKRIFVTHMALTLYMLSSLSVMGQMGQERQLQLINPDGSAAADSVAVGVIAPGVYLNDQLALPSADASGNVAIPSDGRQIVPLTAGKNGLLSIPADAKAVVAQSQQGFAFVPPGALTGKAKLRPWAKLKIDASNVSEQLRSKYQLRFLWRNDFAGDIPSVVLQNMRPAVDPFGGPPADWRFHSYATRFQKADVVDQTITVPPGEVTIVLTVPDFESSASPSVLLVPLGIVRTVSNQTAESALPTFGSAQGRLVGNVNLPNWGRASDQATRIIATPVRAADVPPPRDLGQLLASMPDSQDIQNDPFAAPSVAQQNKIADAYARYFASVEGTIMRTSGIGIAVAATDEQGEFTFDALPIGEYELRMMSSAGMEPILADYGAAQGLTSVESDSPDALRFIVKANELTELGEVRWRLEQGAEEAVKPDDGEIVQSFGSSLPAAGSNAADPNPFADGTAPATDDRAAEIIERWLKSAPQDADRSELKQLLENHLADEFDTNQKTRRAEIDRLQQLLEQSRTWLDQRQQQREAIIQRRVQELLK